MMGRVERVVLGCMNLGCNNDASATDVVEIGNLLADVGEMAVVVDSDLELAVFGYFESVGPFCVKAGRLEVVGGR